MPDQDADLRELALYPRSPVVVAPRTADAINIGDREVKEQIRQGDVLLVYVEHIPADAAESACDSLGRAVLAYGEVSGHAHLIEMPPQGLRYTRTREGERFLALLGQTLIKHGTLTKDGIQDGTADHTALILREGKLQQAFQVEDHGAEIRNVAD